MSTYSLLSLFVVLRCSNVAWSIYFTQNNHFPPKKQNNKNWLAGQMRSAGSSLPTPDLDSISSRASLFQRLFHPTMFIQSKYLKAQSIGMPRMNLGK